MVKSLEFNAGISVVICQSTFACLLLRPSSQATTSFVGDAAIEALGRQHAQFGLSHVEPNAVLWGVVPIEQLNQAGCLLGGESFVT